MTRRELHADPGLESELRRKSENEASRAAQEDYATQHSAYGDWHRSLTRSLYADSGDPDVPRGRR